MPILLGISNTSNDPRLFTCIKFIIICFQRCRRCRWPQLWKHWGSEWLNSNFINYKHFRLFVQCLQFLNKPVCKLFPPHSNYSNHSTLYSLWLAWYLILIKHTIRLFDLICLDSLNLWDRQQRRLLFSHRRHKHLPVGSGRRGRRKLPVKFFMCKSIFHYIYSNLCTKLGALVPLGAGTFSLSRFHQILFNKHCFSGGGTGRDSTNFGGSGKINKSFNRVRCVAKLALTRLPSVSVVL